jgi:Uri superfamily endonuclease
MEFLLPVTLEELRCLGDEELIKRVNNKIAPKIEENSAFSFPDFVSAQFYMGELNRRENRRVETERDRTEKRRWYLDFALESLIVVLILVEIALSISDHRQYSKNSAAELKTFSDMQGILSSLQDTSKATADTMKAERQTMEGMRISLDRQVALFYDVQLNVVYNEATKKLVLINTGRTNVALYEAVVRDGQKSVKQFEKPQLIAPNSTQEFELEESVSALAKELPKGQERRYAFTFFVKNERQERFTLAGDLIAVWRGDVLLFITQPNTIVPGWNK